MRTGRGRVTAWQWVGALGLVALVGGALALVVRITGWRDLAKVVCLTLACAVFAVGVVTCMYLAMGVSPW